MVIAAILLVMSILGVEINELASGYNTTLSWLAWVSLLLLLIGLANFAFVIAVYLCFLIAYLYYFSSL